MIIKKIIGFLILLMLTRFSVADGSNVPFTKDLTRSDVPFSENLSKCSELPINWQGLPEPYHTKSANNPPLLVPQPKEASLSVPENFVVEEYLSGFLRPRFMLLGPENEILMSDMSAGIVYVIRDREAVPLITNLSHPYGMAFYKDWLYVADGSSVKRYKYSTKQGSVGKGEEVISLRRYATGHITRSILFDEAAEKLYLTVGSGSNINLGEPPIRAAISRYNPDGTGFELFATGIRNPVGLQWYPYVQGSTSKNSGMKALWITTHERDGLGDDLVPDYFTKVKEGGFYGWPYAYIGPHEDPRHAGVAPDKVKQTLYPNILLGSHVGSLDFAFYTGTQFPKKYHGGAFLALHGSWNRTKRTGYKIVFVPFENGQPVAGPEDFLTGWMLDEDKTEVWGRPVAVLQMPDGSLLISDDGSGKLWQVSYRK
jgi:glucose/arabinose dehydrogenase